MTTLANTLRRAVVLVALFLVIAAPATASAEIVATDIAGRQVKLAAPAHRLLIDDGRYLIALSLLHDDPVSYVTAWPRDINRIGPAVYAQFKQRFPAIEQLKKTSSSAGSLSVELVLAAEPDLAVFSLTARPSDAEIAQIEAAGVPVAIIDFFDQPLKNLAPSLRFLGKVTGAEDRAEAFIAFRQSRLDEIAKRVAASTAPRPKVFLEPHAARTDECCASPGRGNIGDTIAYVGGDNIGAAAIPSPVGTLNLEYVVTANPDIYIATGGPHMEKTRGLLIGPGYDDATVQRTLSGVAGRSGISGLKAVTEHHVHGIAHQLLNSPLDIVTVEALAKWIRPDLFADLDIEATRKALNDKFLAVPLEGIWWADLK